MKTKFFVLLIAVLTFMAAGFLTATKPNPHVTIKDITVPMPSTTTGEGIQRLPGTSDYVVGQIDLDSGHLVLNFINKLEDIVVHVYHSELGLVATVEVDYDTNPTTLIPISDVPGRYVIEIFGVEYEGEGEYDN